MATPAPPARTARCPAPACPYAGRDQRNTTVHFMRRHVGWVLEFVRNRADRALTALACERVFVNDLTVSLFVLARLATGPGSDTARAQGQSIFQMTGNLLRGESVPYGPVMAECREQLVALLTTYNPDPFATAAHTPPAAFGPRAVYHTPPEAIMQRAETPAAPAPRPNLARATGWQISPRRLFLPISASIWDEARGIPVVQVVTMEQNPHPMVDQYLVGPAHNCVICMETTYILTAHGARLPPGEEPAHLSCKHRNHWIHDTCLAGYIEHQLAIRGVRETEVDRAATGNDESRLLAMEAHLARHPGPFACAHCRSRYESYHAMAKFVHFVRRTYPDYASPNYEELFLQDAMERDNEVRTVARAIQEEDVVVVEDSAAEEGETQDDDGDGSYHGDDDDDDGLVVTFLGGGGPTSRYNLRTRREDIN